MNTPELASQLVLYAAGEERYEVLAAGNGPDGLTIFRQSNRPIELLRSMVSGPNAVCVGDFRALKDWRPD